jgi:hypothetical protein
MEERTSPASALATIERDFAFVVERYGFTVAQSTDVPSFVWYRSGDRTIIVSYDSFDDAAVDVHFEVKSTSERHALSDILAFESFDAARRENVRGPEVAKEVARAAALLGEHCGDFLRGDLEAFRRRYREALLVKTTRAAAMHEFYDGDPKRSRWLFEALRAYWTDLDREHVARLANAKNGTDKSLAHLRLKT